MSERLREALGGLLDGEPPLAVTVDDIVSAGRRGAQEHRRRRRVGIVAAAAAVLVVAGAGVVALVSGGDDDPAVTTMHPAATTTVPRDAVTAPAPSGPEETSSTSVGTSTTTGPGTTAAGTPPGDGTPDAGPDGGTGSGAGPTGELLSDPGFEGSPVGWDTFGPATLLIPTEGARSGRWALGVETTSAAPAVAGATSHPTQARTVPGTRYRASCWVRSPRDLVLRAQLQEHTARGAGAGGPSVSAGVELNDPTRWYEVTVTHVATGSGNVPLLTVFTDDLAAGVPPFVVDDCSLTAASG